MSFRKAGCRGHSPILWDTVCVRGGWAGVPQDGQPAPSLLLIFIGGKNSLVKHNAKADDSPREAVTDLHDSFYSSSERVTPISSCFALRLTGRPGSRGAEMISVTPHPLSISLY